MFSFYGRELDQNTHGYTVHSTYQFSAPYYPWNQTHKINKQHRKFNITDNHSYGIWKGWMPLIFF